MKKSITILALLTAGLCAAMTDQTPATNQAPATTKKKKTKTAAAAKKAAPQPPAIPADAIPNPDGTYAYTDKAGKKWTYAKTPFGVMKSEDSGDAASATSTAPAPSQWTKVTDNGETVKFERQTPFGPIQMEKKKSDLTAEERGMLDSQTANPR